MSRKLTSQLLRKAIASLPTAALRNAGLFLLRAAPALYLLIARGWPKLGEAVGFLRGQHWDLVQLVRDMGFPAPAFFAICASLSESVGTALVASGLLTRLAAAAVTFNMVVAMYADRLTGSSIESAFLYAISFATLALTGPGTLSFHYLRGQKKGHHAAVKSRHSLTSLILVLAPYGLGCLMAAIALGWSPVQYGSTQIAKWCVNAAVHQYIVSHSVQKIADFWLLP